MTAVVLYLHGLNSAPQSVKAQHVARAIAALPSPPRLHVPQLPHRPREAIVMLTCWIDANVGTGDLLTIVGSSLGGFYATCLAERHGARAVTINPAVRPYASLGTFVGTQRNVHTGETWELTHAHLEELLALRVERITRPARYLLLVRSGDELLDWREAVAYYAGAWQCVMGGGDHGWEDFAPIVPTVLQFAGC